MIDPRPVPAQGLETEVPASKTYGIMDADAIMRQYLELRLRALMTEANWIRAQLGKQPRCHKCGATMK